MKVLNELHFVEDLGSGRRNLKRYAPLYYPDYKIEISNGTQFEFSITYDDLSRGKAGEVSGNDAGKATGNATGNVTGKVKRLIKAIGNDTLSVKEIMERLNLKGDDNFRKVYLNPAIDGGYVLRTEENKLRSANQKYYLSDKGKALLSLLP